MPRVLILSSFVSASRVGGGAQALALARLGIEPVLVPTVLFGRHPGWGRPGGGAVDAATVQGMLDGIEAQGGFSGVDAVITGHFSTAEQVAVAARAIGAVRAASPGALIVVDPIMGDAGAGLYVKEAVAQAIAGELAPLADLLCPNAWELERLTDRPVFDPASAVAAALVLRRPVMVSSVEAGAQIGVVYVDEGEAWLAAHARAASAPNGTGDLLTALFSVARITGESAARALELAVGGVAEAIAGSAGEPELSVASMPARLHASPRVRVERLDG
ncbi:MAG: PfkB family carbohydrate kinase [Caulobacterales bacterium]